MAVSKSPLMPMLSSCKPMPCRDLGEQGEMHGRLLVDWRDAHQAFDGETELVAAGPTNASVSRSEHASLLRLFAGIHLHEQARAFSGAFHLLGERRRDLRRSTLWITSNSSTASRALFDCSGPIRCSSRPG